MKIPIWKRVDAWIDGHKVITSLAPMAAIVVWMAFDIGTERPGYVINMGHAVTAVLMFGVPWVLGRWSAS